MSRPEHSAPPEIFYNEAEAEKYTNNTRMMNIQVFFKSRNICVIQSSCGHLRFRYNCVNLHLSQAEMTERALELLCLPDEPCYLLDLGCGSGLSGECIEEQVIFIEDEEHIFSSLVVILGPQLGWSWHLLCHAGGCKWEGPRGWSCLWRSWGRASVQVFRKILSWKWSDFADTNQQGGSFRWCYQHFSFAMAVQCWQILP